MNMRPENLQDAFLNQLRKERTIVTIHLVNGFRITGRIKGFDRFALLIENSGQEQMVFKHAISTITTAKTFRNYIDFNQLKREDNR
ncbi:MAG: RNA chaperone Hfq [Candidatus Aminicenantes bacterium]|nr:RNA chaperone Hfq [Candidatus Aminicenantes bacterium]MDH5714145.1 RNA chaperone Hfq [Candidatus Aminicenantes bacterium]